MIFFTINMSKAEKRLGKSIGFKTCMLLIAGDGASIALKLFNVYKKSLKKRQLPWAHFLCFPKKRQ